MAAANTTDTIAQHSISVAGFAEEENSRWQSIKEEDIILQDGLLRSVGLLPNPFLGVENQDDGRISQRVSNSELEGFLAVDVKSLEELSQRILRICSRSTIDLHTFHEYEFLILRKMWQWRSSNSICPGVPIIPNATVDLEQRGNISYDSHDVIHVQVNPSILESSLSSKLGLLLLIPLLKSQANLDRELGVTTTNLLFGMLSNLPSMSLSEDFDKPLDALEDLLLEWLTEKSQRFRVIGPSTLIALSCARGLLSSFLKSIELLLSMDHLDLKLPLRDILRKLAKLRVRVGEPCAILASKYLSSKPYDDKINQSKKSQPSNPERVTRTTWNPINIPAPRTSYVDHNKISLALDSGFLYVSGTRGQGLSKIGSGYGGTLQGYVYAVNSDIKAWHLAAANNFLLVRDEHLDAQLVFANSVILAETLTSDTLEKSGIVYMKFVDDLPGPYMTIGLTSDGRYFYLLRVPIRTHQDGTAVPSNVKPSEPPPFQVYLDIFEVFENELPNTYFAKLKVPRLALNRNISLEHIPASQTHNTETQASNLVTGTIQIIHPPIQGPNSAEETFHHHSTSLCVDLTDLLKSTIFCCGNYITFLINYEGIGNVPGNTPTTGVQVLIRHLSGISPVQPKVLGKGTQLHIFIGDDGVNYSLQDLVDLPTSSSFIVGAPGIQLGACYDYKNNIIWTSNGQYVDSWKSPGHTPKWHLDSQQLVFRKDYLLEDMNMETAKIINILMLHVGRMASHFICGDAKCNIGFEADYIVTVVNIIKRYADKFDQTQLAAMLLLLQALVSQIKTVTEDIHIGLNEVKAVLCLLMDTFPTLQFDRSSGQDDPNVGLYLEIGKLYALLFEHATNDNVEDLFQELDFSPDRNSRKQEWLLSVRDIVLQDLAFKFREVRVMQCFADKWIVNPIRMTCILKASIDSTMKIFQKFVKTSEGYNKASEMPVSTPETQYLAAVTYYILKRCSARDYPNQNTSSFQENSNALLKGILKNCALIVKRANEFILSADAFQTPLIRMENTLRSSLVGMALPQILLFFINGVSKYGDIANDLREDALHLSVSLSELAQNINIYGFTSYALGEDWSSQFKKPSIWQTYRFIESDHPIKENSKMKETITIPYARRLFVKFDVRCSTHYDYDKFSIFSGTGIEAWHINNYGGTRNRAGNTGLKWPTDFVQVDGDTMSYSFESRGGRERSSPNPTAWGFAFAVYPVYDTIQWLTNLPRISSEKIPKEVPTETNFVHTVALRSLDAVHSFVLKLLEGSEFYESQEKKISSNFYTNRFLTTFDWLTLAHSYSDLPTPTVSKEVFAKLLAIANTRDMPKMRPYMTNLIKPGLLQRLFLTACLKSLFYDKTITEIQGFDKSMLDNLHTDVIREIFHQFTVIIRKLVSLVEMEFRLNQEIEDIIALRKGYDDAFFNSSTFLESQIDVVNISMLLDIPQSGNGQGFIRDIYSFVDAFVADGKVELTKADELVNETHLKCTCMIAAERRGNEYRNVTASNVNASIQIVGSISHFIASHLNQTEDSTMNTFFDAIKQEDRKTSKRCEGLRLLLKLLERSQPYSQLVLSSVLLLQKLSSFQYPLSFTESQRDLDELFGHATKTIVKIAETNQLLYRYPVFLLCILPYKHDDESSIVKSGLLGLLDKLCALQISRNLPCISSYEDYEQENSESSQINRRTASLAWAAFQILAARCSAWGTPNFIDISETLALPVQISVNVTNHLNRASSLAAMPYCNADNIDPFTQLNRTSSLTLTESVQDVLLLLDSLRETKLGRSILKQSPCICRLLSLLQDPGLSPRLTHIILRLLRTALPLANDLNLSDMAKTTLPIVKRSLVPGHGSSLTHEPSPRHVIASLLLSKLADFLICVNQHPASNSTGTKNTEYGSQPKMAVWIHKRCERTRLDSDILRVLFDPGQTDELHPLIASINDMEAALNSENKVKVDVDDGDIAQQKAIKLAQMGFLVSLEPVHNMSILRPNESTCCSISLGAQPSARTREHTFDHIGKERNSELSNLDPSRTFLSGEAAESLAAEIIRLIHTLLASTAESKLSHSTYKSYSESSLGNTTDETDTDSSTTNLSSSKSTSSNGIALGTKSTRSLWSDSVEQTLCVSLKVLSKLSSIGNPIGKPTPLDSYGYSARLAIASLSVLGSFTESIRAEAEVWIGPDLTIQNFKDSEDYNLDFIPTAAKVISVNKSAGLAIVEISDNDNGRSPSRNLEVQLNRLTLREDGYSNLRILSILSSDALQDICRYLKSLFTPSSCVISSHGVDHCPIMKQLPTLSQIFSTATSSTSNSGSNGSSSDAKTLAHGMTVVRLVAEIRTRAAQVLSVWLKNPEFVNMFLGHVMTSESDDILKATIGIPECLGALNILKHLALGCQPSHHLCTLQAQVTRLRLLYRDCTKPPKLGPPNETTISGNSMHWDYMRSTPVIRSCAFRNRFTGVTFAGEPSSGAGNPRGVLLFANKPVPTNGFYFELLIQRMGDPSNDSSPCFSFGLLPIRNEPRRDGASSGAWQYPLGGVMFHSTGRIVHYVGASLLSWKSEKIEESLKIGDTIGIGWEPMPTLNTLSSQNDPIPILRPRYTATPQPQLTSQRIVRPRISNAETSPRTARNGPTTAATGSSAPLTTPTTVSTSLKGYVFLTLNGHRLRTIMEIVDSDMWPCVHLQKGNVSVDANFGAKQFLFPDGRKPIATVPETSTNSVANQVNRFFTSQSSPLEPTGTEVSPRRISESLQDLGVHFGNLTFYPLLDDDDSDSETSFAEAESGTDSISDSSSPLPSQTHSRDEGLGYGSAIPNLVHDVPEDTVPIRNQVVISTAVSRSQALPSISPDTTQNSAGTTVRQIVVQGKTSTNKTINGQTGSAINEQDRIASSRGENKDYSSNCLLDYHLTPSASFDIRVFSGPNRYFCQCAGNNYSELDQYMVKDSDSTSQPRGNPRSKPSDLSRVEGEDVHNLLIRAWEARVFPTIRRRFRNESERREGLEQIRGALQLGMIDIARQTVEFLYEEGNGIPRDLHFPTLEEIRIESGRCTLERIHPGETVTIRSLTRNSNNESILPTYGVSAMLRTFGLNGEVLDVDSAHELILVETYVETEGLLLRFWYPLRDLEKPTSITKPQLNSTTVNMLKLHSNLVALESILCRTYCRQAFLQILDIISAYRSDDSSNFSKSHLPEDLASGLTSLFQELDLENLQIRSEHNFADIPSNGDLLTRNLNSGMVSMDFLTDIGNPSNVFYKESKKLSRDLKCTILRALSQGEDYVNELTNQICTVMKETPSKFIADTIALDKEGTVNISLPDVAFTVVCFRGLQTEKNFASVRNITQPCVHLYGYSGGDSKKYPLACFPIQPVQTMRRENTVPGAGNLNSLSAGGNRNTNFVPLPNILFPTDKLFCSITSTAMKENFLEVQGIPSQFPLALLYSQILVDFARDNETVSRSNILNLICILTNFLERITLVPLLKEWIFAIVSEATNLLKNDIALVQEFYLAHSSMIYGLFRELLVDSREEIKASDAGKSGLNQKTIRITNGQTTLTSATQAGPSRPSRPIRSSQEMSAPAKVRSIIATVRSLVHSESIVKTLKSKDVIGRLQEFPLLSSYLQMLTELCMTLFHVVQLFPTSEPTTIASSDSSPVQTPQRKTSSVVQTTTAGGSLGVSRHLPSSSVSIASNPKKEKIVKITKQSSKIQPNVNALTAVTGQIFQKQMNSLSLDLPTQMLDVLYEIKNGQPAWFNSVYITCQLLKSVIWSEKGLGNIEMLSSFIVEATSAMHFVTNHSRLIVICDAPKNIHEMPLETSLIRALNEYGGVFGSELWISDSLGDVVVEARTAQKTEDAIKRLKQNQTWYPIEDFNLYPSVAIHSVNENLETGDLRADQVLKTYLSNKIFDPIEQDKFRNKAEDVISHIFTSCYVANEALFNEKEVEEEGTILLEDKYLLNVIQGNLMEKFIVAAKPSGLDSIEFIKTTLRRFGQHKNKLLVLKDFDPTCAVPATSVTTNQTKLKTKLKDDKTKLKTSKDPSGIIRENLCLSLKGFLQWTTQLGKDNICTLWRALLATGHDIRLDRTWISESSVLISLMTNGGWTREKDAALTLYIDRLAETLRVPPQFIHPHEIYFEQNHFSNTVYSILQDTPLEVIRSRCAILQLLNLLVSKNVLSYVPLHLGQSKKLSTAALIRDSQHILFYHLKDEFLYKVLQFSSLRGDDTPPPELFLDPLQVIGSSVDECGKTMFSSVLNQLHEVSSALLVSKPAFGGDPPLPIVVKFVGEEVHGLIGSFRHFLSNAVNEIKSPVLQLLIKCPSSDAGRNKDSMIIRPGPLTLGEEKLLTFFGQFIGLCIRADAPMSCSLLSSTWKSLMPATNEDKNEIDELQEVDILTSSFLNSLQSVESAEEFNEVLKHTDYPKFVYLSMDGKSLVPLCPAGDKLNVSWDTRQLFIQLVKKFRGQEMKNTNRVNAILGGLSTLLPMPVIVNLFSPRHLELRVSGSPDINLPFLKVHTHYQVGISETDLHILFFWATLESMTSDELKNFIKFASNQERLPITCPCQNQSTTGGINLNNLIHVPPFPMKIAPIDIPPGASQDYINKRTVRAETCLFLIRLPPYSSYKVTRDQLLFACNSRDDPLSG